MHRVFCHIFCVFIIIFLGTRDGFSKRHISKDKNNEASPEIVMPEPDVYGNLPTLNKFGFLCDEVFINPFAKDFVMYAVEETKSDSKRVVMEIGAGYGHLSLQVLRSGKSSIIINDLDQGHLDLIKQRLPHQLRERVEWKRGKFPDDLEFYPESMDGIFCRVLQFLSGKEIESGLEKMLRWLKPGGRLYITAPTIYMRDIPSKIQDIFHQKRLSGEKWPGQYTESALIYPKEILKNMPEYVHLFDMDVLMNNLLKASFTILKVEYFNESYRLDQDPFKNRQMVGIVAMKPFAS